MRADLDFQHCSQETEKPTKVVFCTTTTTVDCTQCTVYICWQGSRHAKPLFEDKNRLFFFLKGTFRKENVHFGFFSHRNLQTEQYTVGDDDAVSTVTETLFQF